MKTLAILFCTLALSGVAFAQINYNSAIRQAHNAVGQTEAASQGQPPQSSQPPAQNSATTNPKLAATLQNIASLRADFDNLSKNLSSSSYTNDLVSAATGTKASAATVAKLAGDLRAAIAGNEKLNAQHQKLAQDIHAIFNSAFLSADQRQTIEDDIHNILKNGGVPSDEITAVDGDVKSVADETK